MMQQSCIYKPEKLLLQLYCIYTFDMKDQFAGFNIDFVGFITSLLCAIHCACLPLLLSLTSLVGLGFLNNPWIEYSIVLISLSIASYALILGYRRCHHKPLALIVVFNGFALIILGHFLNIEWIEITFTSSGAIAVASAHFINWKHIRHKLLKEPAN